MTITLKLIKKDYFKLGGKSEFFGKSLNEQIEKINSGLKFLNHGIKLDRFLHLIIRTI